MTANERRNEIIRILVSRRHETMKQLASELKVTDRTIRTDITILTGVYPLETIRGNGGGVKLADYYHPYANKLTQEQQNKLIEILDTLVDKTQQKVLTEVIFTFGSYGIRERFKNHIVKP